MRRTYVTCAGIKKNWIYGRFKAKFKEFKLQLLIQRSVKDRYLVRSLSFVSNPKMFEAQVFKLPTNYQRASHFSLSLSLSNSAICCFYSFISFVTFPSN